MRNEAGRKDTRITQQYSSPSSKGRQDAKECEHRKSQKENRQTGNQDPGLQLYGWFACAELGSEYLAQTDDGWIGEEEAAVRQRLQSVYRAKNVKLGDQRSLRDQVGSLVRRIDDRQTKRSTTAREALGHTQCGSMCLGRRRSFLSQCSSSSSKRFAVRESIHRRCVRSIVTVNGSECQFTSSHTSRLDTHIWKPSLGSRCRRKNISTLEGVAPRANIALLASCTPQSAGTESKPAAWRMQAPAAAARLWYLR